MAPPGVDRHSGTPLATPRSPKGGHPQGQHCLCPRNKHTLALTTQGDTASTPAPQNLMEHVCSPPALQNLKACASCIPEAPLSPRTLQEVPKPPRSSLGPCLAQSGHGGSSMQLGCTSDTGGAQHSWVHSWHTGQGAQHSRGAPLELGRGSAQSGCTPGVGRSQAGVKRSPTAPGCLRMFFCSGAKRTSQTGY